MTAPRDEGWDDVPPATGTFRTSWQTVLRDVVVPGLGGVGVIVVLYWLSGEPLVDMLWVGGTTLVGIIAFYVGRYFAFGVASVDVASGAVTIERMNGATIRIPWGELTQAWQRNKWYFETRERSVNVYEYGFTVEEWMALSAAIYQSKDAGPVETLPGVLARPAEGGEQEVAVYEAQHNSALWWGPPLFALMGAGALLASWSSYRDGTWTDELMLAVACPIIFFGFVAAFALGLHRLVQRATFLPEHLVIERYVGPPKTIRYGDMLDFHGRHVVTRHGKFAIGDRNSGAFWRLLEPHVEDRQLSGEMGIEFTVSLPYSMWGSVAGFVLGFVVSLWAGYRYQLSEGLTTAVFFGVMLGCFGAAALLARVAARRAKRELIEA